MLCVQVGDTALIDAARYQCQGVIEELIAHGANVDVKNKVRNCTKYLLSVNVYPNCLLFVYTVDSV